MYINPLPEYALLRLRIKVIFMFWNENFGYEEKNGSFRKSNL
jgi:hypothetical protein